MLGSIEFDLNVWSAISTDQKEWASFNGKKFQTFIVELSGDLSTYHREINQVSRIQTWIAERMVYYRDTEVQEASTDSSRELSAQQNKWWSARPTVVGSQEWSVTVAASAERAAWPEWLAAKSCLHSRPQHSWPHTGVVQYAYLHTAVTNFVLAPTV